MRLIFMGTPEFAVPSLLRLAEQAAFTIVGVVTRRDRPAGRGSILTPPPVKVAALERGLPVLQPGSLRRPEAQAAIAALQPDLIAVAAFGQILPQVILDLPPYGCLNVHASLLPRHRGASPIASAILSGDDETGVTIMLMDAGLDTGPWLAQNAIGIARDDTTATLTRTLAQLGADLLATTLPAWIDGALAPIPQHEGTATISHLIRKEDGDIVWSQSAEAIARQVRAYTPWPGTSTRWKGQSLKIHSARPIAAIHTERPGTVVMLGKADAIAVVCGDQALLQLDVIQLAGKRAIPAIAVVHGQPSLVGSVLGET